MEELELPGVTIDAEETRDIDDAIAVTRIEDGWRVRVLIADVAKSVWKDSPLDKQAHSRVVTQYFRNGNFPMLPRFLSDRALSLWPGESRRVLCIDWVMGPDFETQHCSVYESKFRSMAKLTYAEIPQIAGDPGRTYHSLITDAKILSLALLAKRRKNGAMVLYDLNNGWVSTEEGFLRKVENKDDVLGQIIVQELMIRANCEVARWGIERDVPLLFRNHLARDTGPEMAVLAKQIQDGYQTPIEGLEELRHRTHQLLGRAEYGAAQEGHFGLNVPAYLHFTSPIRRFADLINHRQIKAAIRSQPCPYTVEQIEAVATHINTKVAEERQSRNEFEKRRAENGAKRAIEAGRLPTLPVRELERAVKVEARSGVDASDPFTQGFLRTHPSLLAFTVILGEAGDGPNWRQVKAHILKALVQRPEDAISVLAQGVQLVGWAEVNFKSSVVGPSHLPVFDVTAEAGPFSASAKAHSVKIAKGRAATRLLAQMASLDAPQFDEPATPEVRQAVANPVPTGERNWIGELQELSQQKRWASPAYQFTQVGPTHTPVFTCTCRFGTVEKVAVASSKKEAKSKAAAAMVQEVVLK